MDKRRVRLEINGIVCGLITEESDEYMKSLADEVGNIMRGIMAASPFVTREAAALTAALSCCDDAKKNDRKAMALQARVDELEVQAESPAVVDDGLAEQLKVLEERARSLEKENAVLRADALECAEALKEISALHERVTELETQLEEQKKQAVTPALDALERQAVEAREDERLQKALENQEAKKEKPAPSRKKRKNPLRYEEEFQQEGFVSFFEKKD